jgi:hypothetical protein
VGNSDCTYGNNYLHHCAMCEYFYTSVLGNLRSSTTDNYILFLSYFWLQTAGRCYSGFRRRCLDPPPPKRRVHIAVIILYTHTRMIHIIKYFFHLFFFSDSIVLKKKKKKKIANTISNIVYRVYCTCIYNI